MPSLCLVVWPLLIAVLCLLLILVAWCRHLGLRVAALDRVSTLDPLTGLPNGRLFEAERWPAAIRAITPLCVLYVDLDHLKANNDRFGRSPGDRYITRSAALLRQACRRGVDPIFRLHTAGDEFVVLLRGDDALYGDTVAQHILCSLLREGISASIGIASTRRREHQLRAALLEQAEQAVRQAKREGKGRFVVFRGSPASPNDAVPETVVDGSALPTRRLP